jgi:hypothetical protein
VNGKPGTASVPVKPPFLLDTGYTFIQVHVVTPFFGGKSFFVGPGPFIHSAIAELITVAFAANGACNGECHRCSPLFQIEDLRMKIEYLNGNQKNKMIEYRQSSIDNLLFSIV